jgi:serine/threonine protein kinase
MALDHGPTRAERAGDTVAPEPDRLGPYRLVSRLGEGGMGVVHLGLDGHGRAVAIKVLRPHVAYDPEARWRLEREVDTLTRIVSSRVAAVIDSDIVGDRPYLVTRYVAGPSLDDVVTDEGPLGPDELVRLGLGLVEALEAIHAVGVVHRDLKPGNVLLEDGEPVVIDFGIAHIADDVRLTSSGLVMGTPGYLSPEVIGGSPVTQATDWWGWAATLAFAASGRAPFGRGPMDVVLGRVSRGETDLTGVDGRLSPLLAAALSPDPSRRPPTGEVVAALERYASGGPAAAPLRGPAPWTPEWAASAAAAALASPSTGNSTGNSAWANPTGPGAYGSDLGPPPMRSGSTSELPASGREGEDWDDESDDDPEQSDPEQSDWQAAWDADPDEPDPRINRPKRTGTLLALAAAFTATAAVWPGIALVLAVVWCWLARFSDRSVTALILRRYRYGRRRADLPMAVALSPWHLVVAAGLTLGGLLVPVLVAVSATFCATLGISTLTSATAGPAMAPAVAVGFAAGVLIAWWGPGGASLRRGSRSLVRGVARGETVTAVVIGVLLLAAAVLAVLAFARHGQLTWWPLPWGS